MIFFTTYGVQRVTLTRPSGNPHQSPTKPLFGNSNPCPTPSPSSTRIPVHPRCRSSSPYILTQLDLPYILHWILSREDNLQSEPGEHAQTHVNHAPRESNNPFRGSPPLTLIYIHIYTEDHTVSPRGLGRSATNGLPWPVESLVIGLSRTKHRVLVSAIGVLQIAFSFLVATHHTNRSFRCLRFLALVNCLTLERVKDEISGANGAC